MNRLITSHSKTLKLMNVLKYGCPIQNEEFDFNVTVEQMQSYIKAKGAAQVGPLIQYTRPFVNQSGELDMEFIVMLQCSHLIHQVGLPYQMEPMVRVTNCMYCRYIGPGDKVKYAYDKIGVEAFENGIRLQGSSYTIFVDEDEVEETITADIFMERVD